MNQENQEEDIMESFLSQVKGYLPGYIKEKKKELQDVLEEIRERVLDNAEALTRGKVISDETIRKVIADMGGARKVANQYKRKGTPKYYISEELWPFYKKLLLIIAGAVLLANVIALVVNLFSGGGASAIWSMLSGLQGGIFVSFTIVTLIFVWLSMEGYMPRDFDEMECEEVKTKGKKLKNPFSRSGKLFEAGAGLVFALLAITQPFQFLNASMHPDFLVGIRWLGILWLISSLLNLSEALVGTKHLTILQSIKFIGTIVGLFGLGFILMLIQRPDIIPYFNIGPGGVLVAEIMPEEFYIYAKGGLIVLVVIIIIASLAEVIETILLRNKVKKYQQSLL
ncbi:MAG: hypothetical protein ACFFCS_11765 [Candidatus Hodarchaeota archaeon]